MTRAGKDKSVEKKKAKTGRAKRGLQYNSRPVTESNTFGKKKSLKIQIDERSTSFK